VVADPGLSRQDDEPDHRRDGARAHHRDDLVEPGVLGRDRGQGGQRGGGHAEGEADEREADQVVTHGVAGVADAEGQPAVGARTADRGGEHRDDVGDLGREPRAESGVEAGRERGARHPDADEDQRLAGQPKGQDRATQRNRRHPCSLSRPPHASVDATSGSPVNEAIRTSGPRAILVPWMRTGRDGS
jgi:hypothetical protein